MAAQKIAELADGPLDIVGDVHGEIQALEHLLARLQYGPDGCHPAGRRLVFLGDLVDRGEDSPSVVERVAELVAAGRAQFVLGNHELNLLLDQRKEGNGWFYPEESDQDHAAGHFLKRPRPIESPRRVFINFFATLPLASEQPDFGWSISAVTSGSRPAPC